jgi:hypothetical protein
MPAALAARTALAQSAPEIVTRAAVVIGVDQPHGLPKLRAAASGAKTVADWLENQQHFKVRLLTDNTQPVSAADIFKAIDYFVGLETVQQLVVYFAGHGGVVGYGEYWLLSEAPHNPNEAVSFPETFDLARYCNIPNIVFISDACRSTSESLSAQHMRGQLIFPNLGANSHVSTKIDKFLAAAIGSPAYEVKYTAGRYDGIYTECFLDAYNDPYYDIVKEVDGVLVVPNRNMDPYLSKIVPGRVAAAFVTISQDPLSIIESGPDVYVGHAAKAPLPTRRLDNLTTIPTISYIATREFKNLGFDIGTVSANFRESEQYEAFLRSNPAFRQYFECGPITDPLLHVQCIESFVTMESETVKVRDFDRDRTLILWARGPNVFKYGTGVNVFGARVRAIGASQNIQAQVLQRGDPPSEPTVIQVDPGTDRQGTVVIEFEDGSGTVLAAIRQFVANVVVARGKVANVSYVPGEIGEQLNRTESHFPELDQLHALIAASAKLGVFQIGGPPEIREARAQRFADTVRQGKLADPTLGIYAAYAYAEAGMPQQIRSVFEIMRDSGIELFDVAMLAGVLSGRVLWGPAGDLPAPFCPMLSQGWGLLRARNVTLPEELVSARDHLLRALWTTFDAEGLRIIQARLDRMPIRSHD